MDKTVVITGATKGLGLVLSSMFAKEGYRLLISGRNEVELQEVARKLKGVADLNYVKADVSKKEDCKHLIEKGIELYGHIDIMINNAGVWTDKMDPDSVDRIIDTNLKGVEYCCGYVIPQMEKQQSGGMIVNIGSTSGIRFRPGGIYSSSKFGVVSYSASLYMQYSKNSKVNVICFCPGGIKTELFRSNPGWVADDFMSPQAVARVILAKVKNNEKGLFVLERDGTLNYSEFSISWNWTPQDKVNVKE